MRVRKKRKTIYTHIAPRAVLLTSFGTARDLYSKLLSESLQSAIVFLQQASIAAVSADTVLGIADKG